MFKTHFQGIFLGFFAPQEEDAFRVGKNQLGVDLQRGVIWNKHPRAGERPVYKPEFDSITNSLTRDYALVLMLPNENKKERTLLIYGIYTQGSQAALEYVTSADRMQELREALAQVSPDQKTPPNFFRFCSTPQWKTSSPARPRSLLSE